MTPVEIERAARAMRKKIADAKPELDIKGTTYYVSADGDDTNDGLTPETAWKTLDAPFNHSESFKAGDAVLFRCGDIFAPTYERQTGIALVSGVTYSSYGEGKKPELRATVCNAAELDWKKESENLYSLKLNHEIDIGNIVFNHGEEWGYKKVKGLDEITTPEMDLEYFHDVVGQKLYIYSENGNPSLRWYDIQLCHRCVILRGIKDHCLVDGLSLKYTGGFGISGNLAHDITVRNCEFEWIGGSLAGDMTKNTVRYGNGYETWGGVTRLTVKNCYFAQCYDAALTQQYSDIRDFNMSVVDCVFSDNLFEKNTYDYEYFLSEWQTREIPRPLNPDTQFFFKNVYFENNICRQTGYGFGNQRPDRHSPACIKSWTHQNKSENFIIRNNIFDRCDYRLVQINACEDKYLPTLSGNTYCQYLGKGLIERQRNTSTFTSAVANQKKIENAEEDSTLVIARW